MEPETDQTHELDDHLDDYGDDGRYDDDPNVYDGTYSEE